MMRFSAILLGASVMACLGGCAGIGPMVLPRDRFDYNAAIADSWKQQMLVNLVKIRYGDTPVFLDVTSVISQYSVAVGVNSGLEWQQVGPNTQSLSANASYIDRPTITYSPLSGAKFAQNIMTPIPPTAILSLIQSGYPVDLVFRLAVQSINGIYNRTGRLLRTHPAEPEFYSLIEKLQRIQDSGGIGIRVNNKEGQKGSMIVLKGKASKSLEADQRWVRETLGLNVNRNDFKVVFGAISANDGEIAILTRSVLDILTNLSLNVEVPLDDVEEERVNATMSETTSNGISLPPLISIHCSTSKPSNAFIEVRYRGQWFWIDDRDFRSKSLFSFIYFLFSLTETGEPQQGAPIVTIPIN
jgi:hypothetical protein